MSPRRKRKARGAEPPALFTWTRHGDATPGGRDNPRTRKCKTCKATPGEPCTRSGRGGRVPIDSYHDNRRNPTQDDQQPTANPPSVAARAPGAPKQ